MLVAFSAIAVASGASAAHYGTSPPAPAPSFPTLSISDHAPLCAPSQANCIETTGAVRAYPVANGDRITVHWTNDPNGVDGVIHLGNLYLPMDNVSASSVAPVTFEVHLPTDRSATVAVEYAGTRHHVPLAPGAWQPLSIHNPDERIIYLRLDLPRQPLPN